MTRPGHQGRGLRDRLAKLLPARRVRTAVLLAASALALASIARGPSLAFAQMGEDRPVIIENDTERHIYAKLRCMCGGCARLDLATCTCSYAADRRAEIRAQLKSGMTPDDVVAAYVKHFGTDSLEIPSNEGANRLLYVVPITLILGGAVFLGLLLRRLRGGPPKGGAGGGAKGGGAPKGGAKGGAKGGDGAKRDDYDERLDDELKRLDE
jgi:cytochrome c-type biogenesis protein CcmH